ncbi:MAG TPA: VOC family protein [Thermoanaerobaculia bacterium]|nr:VOC family protein [Thermoanaerobaculia bacterium]
MTAITRLTLCAVLALAGLACAGAGHPPAKEPAAMDTAPKGDVSRVDHVILGIDDLQKGIEELERRTGVRAEFGGVHPGRGTQNALISLGEHHYLEILAPNPKEKGSEMADELRKLTALTPVGWAARANDLPSTRRLLQEHGAQTGEIRPGARKRPDGARLAWKTLDYTSPSSPLLPFFIEWDHASAHPSATSPQGCRLTDLYLEDPSPAVLRDALRAADVGVEVREGQESRIHLSLACPKGTVDF